MYYTKMTFTPLKKMEITENNVEDMDIAGNIWGYLGDLLRNGQVYEDQSLIYNDNNFQAFFFMPELDSLEEKNCNRYVLESLAQIKQDYAVTHKVLGQNAVVNTVCSCRNSTWYFLYACHNYAFSPIICGDCSKMIPVYKLSQIELPKDCQSELGWQADYTLIDKLWFNSGFDHFTYRQMSNPKSKLSKTGREICAAYEKALGKPFYYFLFHYSASRRLRKKCPDCGGEWMLKDAIGHMTFKCDKCRLISY